MGWLSGFWAGAQDHGLGLDWTQWPEGDDVPPIERLLAFGLDRTRADAWLRTPPRWTMGDVVVWTDEDYPPALRQMRSPPPVLCVDGDRRALAGPGLAIVGTRGATRYGRAVARDLGRRVASAGWTVVSGLARGIDGEAHIGALEAGRTVAVVDHGLGHTAPASHGELRRRIVAGGGAIVSVWPDDRPPRPYTFPARNAWIAGLSEASVVVEAGERSGALITARCALAEGRDVFAVPGPLGASASVGCLRLLEDGAAVIVDVPSFIGRLTGVARGRDDALVDDLGAGVAVEELARRRGTSVADMLTQLSLLEARGMVRRVGPQRYSATAGAGV